MKPPSHFCDALRLGSCEVCDDFVEARATARDEDFETDDYYLGDFDPDFHFPRDLAPQGGVMTALANDMSDRQWAAAYVIDNAPICFDPLAEATRARDLAVGNEFRLTAPALLAAFDDLVTELDELPTIREQRALLDSIARGES